MYTVSSKIPRVALVGRRNVGKSTLLNALYGRRYAITDETPGLTRDILEIEIRYKNYHFLLSDTPGLDVEDPSVLEKSILERAKLHLNSVDLLLLVFAAPAPHPFDLDFVRLLRKNNSSTPQIYLVNKIDNAETADQVLVPFYEAQLTDLLPISAKGRWNLNALLVRMGKLCGEIIRREESDFQHEGNAKQTEQAHTKSAVITIQPEDNKSPREERDDSSSRMIDTGAFVGELGLAIVGRPNVGKSSLFNCILRQERALISDLAGTTRDTIDTLFHYDGQAIRIMDTAGMRHATRLQDLRHKIEFYSWSRTKRAIQKAKVVIQIIDGLTGLTDFDKRICSMLQKYRRAVLLVVSKWDILKGLYDATQIRSEFEDRLAFLFPHISKLPLIFCSSVSGHGIKRILDTCLTLNKAMQKRIATADLNRHLGKWQKTRPPNSSKCKIFYAVQDGSMPPSFIFFVNEPKLFSPNLRSYFENCLRKQYRLTGLPIQIYARGRRNSHASLVPSRNAKSE